MIKWGAIALVATGCALAIRDWAFSIDLTDNPALLLSVNENGWVELRTRQGHKSGYLADVDINSLKGKGAEIAALAENGLGGDGVEWHEDQKGYFYVRYIGSDGTDKSLNEEIARIGAAP